MGVNDRSILRRLHHLRMAMLLGCGWGILSPSLIRAQGGGACHVTTVPTGPDSLPHGRLADPRISYLTLGDFAGPHGAYVCRWHLRPWDPAAPHSNVVRPITYLIDDQIPTHWLSSVIQGVQAWQPVFDAIGLHHVLTTRVVSQNDSLWTAPFVVTIRLNDGPTSGGHTWCDARATTGEIVRCTITLNRGLFERGGQYDCMLEAGSDPTLPFPCPDSVLEHFVQGVVAHEVGHSLGLDHNIAAGRAYPTDSLRSAAFVHHWGFASSVMHHFAYDEVAQPGDDISQRDRWLKIGPYDYWAIAWAYRPIPGSTTPEDEQTTLEQWRTAQDTAAYLRVQASTGRMWGGDDVLRAVELQQQNAARLWTRLATRPQDRAKFLATVDSATPTTPEEFLIDNWTWRMLQVVDLLGGQVPQPPYPSRLEKARTLPVNPARQLQALQFLLAHVVYGRDPVIQAWERFAYPGPTQAHGASTSGIPLVFDTVVQHTPLVLDWAQAQQLILARLVSRMPHVPAEALPKICHELTAVVHDLTQPDIQTTATRAAATETLRGVLVAPLNASGVCAGTAAGGPASER